MELMAKYPDKHFDLAIVDPPYGIGVSKGTWGSGKKAKVTNYGKKNWDHTTPNQLYFDELFRVSKNQIIFGANYFISKIPYDSPCWIVWDKDNSGGFADCELAWSSFKTAVKKFKYTWNGMLQENMKQKEIRIHPTQKPVKLYEWILTNYAKPTDLILDTHVGSASSLIACENTGNIYVGCELDKDYYEASLKRLEDHCKQQKLF
jgi:site-specific DNA-methyltransferase (adenine-specific)